MLRFVILRVAMPRVIMLRIVMLSVEVPSKGSSLHLPKIFTQ